MVYSQKNGFPLKKLMTGRRRVMPPPDFIAGYLSITLSNEFSLLVNMFTFVKLEPDAESGVKPAVKLNFLELPGVSQYTDARLMVYTKNAIGLSSV